MALEPHIRTRLKDVSWASPPGTCRPETRQIDVAEDDLKAVAEAVLGMDYRLRAVQKRFDDLFPTDGPTVNAEPEISAALQRYRESRAELLRLKILDLALDYQKSRGTGDAEEILQTAELFAAFLRSEGNPSSS